MDEISKLLWEEQKERETLRAYAFCIEKLKSPLTLEEFRKVWYREKEDKCGKEHLANLCTSIFQSRKVNAGKSFENSLERLFEKNTIHFLKQKCVDDSGKIYLKKPTNKSVHKLDFIVVYKNSENIETCIVISAKTKFRERWRQDLHLKEKCKKLIYITKEVPSRTLIEQIVGYNTTLVYPNAIISENIWSFEHFVLRMKHFQETGSYSMSQ